MLARSELQALAQWCQVHFIRWMPATEEGGRPAMVLEGSYRRRSWTRMLLVLVDEGFCLVTESGETLATASGLAAVLDALNDGAPRLQPAAQSRPSFRCPTTEQTTTEQNLSFVL